MDINWLYLLVAFAVGELIHNLFEIWGMRQKVAWLGLVMNGKPHGKWPLYIKTYTQVWVLHIAILVSVAGLSYGLFMLLNISDSAAVFVGILTLLICYATVVHKVHRFHMEIGRLIRKAKKANNL